MELIDYTKFKQKRKEELVEVLADKDDIFVVACNKCFKEFEDFEGPNCSHFEILVRDEGKEVVGCAPVDFLCNEPMTSKALEGAFPHTAKNVFVLSCGLGIQTVAGLTELPVYAGSDSVTVHGQHGLALTEKLCEACAQCYLNETGGICPVVDCAKSLLNGQCGGSQDGKCEVDKEMDCAWQNIYNRMEKQGRLDELKGTSIDLRDYSKVNYKFISEYVQNVRENRYEGYYGGIHPTEHKELSEHLSPVSFPDPVTVVIPTTQHLGAPANAIVEVGQVVKLGEKIAEAGGVISSNIHASVSGTVVAVEPRFNAAYKKDILSIVIQSDGKNTLHESVKSAGKLEDLTSDEIIEIVREKGIVGMGGAAFPTAVKLKAPKPIDVVILNGCECEPILTSDHWVMNNYADEVIYGLKAMMKASGAPKGIIALEDNKEDAVEILQEKTDGMDDIEVVVAKTKYPQGAEKMLIKRVLGVEVPRGGLPMDVGAVVANVSTAKAVSDAIQTGMPPVERVVTVSGEYIKSPGNYIIKNGTSIKSIIEHCGGITDDDVTVKVGGPMMGVIIDNYNTPVLKSTNGIIAVETQHKEAVECIKCGRCMDVCPMELRPLYYAKYATQENWEGMKAQNINDCIECGCCEYICASKIPIVERIKMGKTAVREGK